MRRQERTRKPIFDVIVELSGRKNDTVRVIMEVSKAVDAIAQGRSYDVQERMLCMDGDAVALLMEEFACWHSLLLSFFLSLIYLIMYVYAAHILYGWQGFGFAHYSPESEKCRYIQK